MSEEDKKMMSDPKTWPNWPTLPVKRYVEHDMESGFMIAIKGKLTTVFITNPWSVWSGETSIKKALNGPKKEYGSVDEIIADGWIVD